MFTGIVKAMGIVSRVDARGGDLRLTIRSPEFDWEAFEIGESICVNGVCLTAVEFKDSGFVTDVSRETMNVTALSGLAAGHTVNLEPSLALGERLGGHLVSGHVDCVGVIAAVHNDARSLRLAINAPSEFVRYVARKGSICVDGVSLTINAVSAGKFELNIIPHTAETTIIGGYTVGTRVNIEVDLLARYVERLLSKEDGDGLSLQTLREHGYAK